VAGITNMFTYVAPASYHYVPNFGPNLDEFHEAWEKAHPEGSGVEFGGNAIYGFMTGLVMERALATTESLEQLAIHNAVFALSGKLVTLDGPFALDETGGQIGEITPLGQLQPDGKGGLNLGVVFPLNLATIKPNLNP